MMRYDTIWYGVIRYAKYGAIPFGLNGAICCVKSFAIG